TATGLINTGSLVLRGSSTKLATVNILGSAPSRLGKIDIQGDVLLQFASGAVSGISLGDTLMLRNDPTPLSLNASGITSGTFSNAGTLSVDSGLYHAGGSNLAIGATLINSGVVNIGDPNLGNPTTVTATGLINTGTNTQDGRGAKHTALNDRGAGRSNRAVESVQEISMERMRCVGICRGMTHVPPPPPPPP